MLEKFLNAKPLYYDEIDYTRMPRVYESVKKKLKLPKIIHLIGTNGKGTTGRFLATALHSIGYSVGHYSSPHILEFNERIWMNASNVTEEILEAAHQKLLLLLREEDANLLSYFEYTTLLAMVVYAECDYVVLEAGLGGEHDATSVFANILTLVTPIGKDHEAFLGDTIEEIATTKLNAIQKNAILAKQVYSEVQEIAQKIAFEKNLEVYTYSELLNAVDLENIYTISKNLELAEYLQENLQLCVAALNFLKINYSISSFNNSRLFGRLWRLDTNILIDVGHNVLAAQEILKDLNGKKYILVYNSYKDKDYREILTILRPIIKHIEIIKVEEARIESLETMQETLHSLEYAYHEFEKTDKESEYLVFGSFSVVEAFLKVHNG